MRATSRNDTALHRSAHRPDHAVARSGRLAFHLARAAFTPTRCLDELLREIEAAGCAGLNRVIVLRAKAARDAAWPYLTDETGDIWR